MNQIFDNLKKLKKSSRDLAQLSNEKIDEILLDLAEFLRQNFAKILQANELDLSKMDKTSSLYDRLKLTEERINDIANAVKNLANFPSPVGETFDERIRPNGLKIYKKRVPIGVIGMIYEARPNVTIDAFSIAFKTKNAIALKGGSDAHETNKILVEIIREILIKNDISPDCVYLLSPEREGVSILLQADKYVDVIIPRGSAGLIKFVRENSLVPILETGAGVVHTYFDKDGDLEKAKKIIFSAKTRRPSVCNALDCLIIHSSRLKDLPELLEKIIQAKVQIYADENSYEILSTQNLFQDENLGFPASGLAHFSIQPLTEKSFGTEFLGLEMSIKTVDNFEQALEHIYKYSSFHSESIITENENLARNFLNRVDAACVFWNTETGWADGEEFGLGAEIGISTQKLHARGPMALNEMTTYKWIVEGDGQTRMKV